MQSVELWTLASGPARGMDVLFESRKTQIQGVWEGDKERTQEVLAKSIEKITLNPIKFQGAMGASVEVGIYDTVEADRKRGSHLAMTTHGKTLAAPALNQFAAAADDGPLACFSHA